MATTTTQSKVQTYDIYDTTIDHIPGHLQIRLHGPRSIKAVISLTPDEAETFALQLIRNAHESRRALYADKAVS